MPAKTYTITAAHTDGPLLILQDIQALEARCHQLGLMIGARALNNAKNAIGWEAAGNTDAADLATRGLRVGS